MRSISSVRMQGKLCSRSSSSSTSRYFSSSWFARLVIDLKVRNGPTVWQSFSLDCVMSLPSGALLGRSILRYHIPQKDGRILDSMFSHSLFNCQSHISQTSEGYTRPSRHRHFVGGYLRSLLHQLLHALRAVAYVHEFHSIHVLPSVL